MLSYKIKSISSTFIHSWKVLLRLPPALWTLAFSMFVNRLGLMVYPLLTVYLVQKLGLTPSDAGLILSSYGVISFLTSPIAGKMSDWLGSEIVLKGSLVISGIVTLIYPSAQSFLSILGLTVLLAISGELFRPALLSLTAELATPEDRKNAFTLSRIASNLGISAGPAMGGLLYARWGFAPVAVIEAMLTFVAAFILIQYLPSVSRSPKGRVASSSTANDLNQQLRYWLKLLLRGHAEFKLFLSGVVTVIFIFFQFNSTVPYYLRQYLKLPEYCFGLLFTLNATMVIFLEVPVNMATEKLKIRTSLIVGSLLLGSGFGFLFLSRDGLTVALSGALLTLGEITLFPAMSAYVAGVAPKDKTGLFMGIYMMAFNLAFALGPYLGIVTLEKWDHGGLAILCFVLALASAWLFSRVDRKSPGLP